MMNIPNKNTEKTAIAGNCRMYEEQTVEERMFLCICEFLST